MVVMCADGAHLAFHWLQSIQHDIPALEEALVIAGLFSFSLPPTQITTALQSTPHYGFPLQAQVTPVSLVSSPGSGPRHAMRATKADGRRSADKDVA